MSETDANALALAGPRFSVIVPARNAAATIAQTLDALRDQTEHSWEVLVVVDSSTDDSEGIAATYAAGDGRFRVFSVDAGSEAAARNAGVDQARADWVLFLDADDLIAPVMLGSVREALDRDPSLDAVVCGWQSFVDGREWTHWPAMHWEDHRDHFLLAASHTPFPVHACVVRRSLVLGLGGFDPSVKGVADWDFWQRVFRSGARVGRLGHVCAYYRLHAGAMSRDASAMCRTSLRVLDRAYAPDPRVSRPLPAYANGAPRRLRRAAVLRHVCWWGGAAVANGADPCELIDMASGAISLDAGTEDDEVLPPEVAAFALEQAFRIPGSLPSDGDVEGWRRVRDVVRSFLSRLEGEAGAEGLAWRTELLLQPSECVGDGWVPRRRASVQAVDVDLAADIAAVDPDDGIDTVVIVGRLAGRAVGVLDVPAAHDHDALRDAIADRFAWELCRYHLERRGIVGPSDDGLTVWTALVDEILPVTDAHARRRLAVGQPAEIVAGGPPTTVLTLGRSSVPVRLRIGGERLAGVRIPAAEARSARRLTRALAHAYGPRLTHAVARAWLTAADRRVSPGEA